MCTKIQYIDAREALRLHEEGEVEVFAEIQERIHGQLETVDFSLNDHDLSEVEGLACDENYKFFIE